MGKRKLRWPWPEHTAHDRFRRIVEIYRDALFGIAPQACRQLDAQMAEWGQEWVSSDIVVDVDRMMTAGEIAAEFGIEQRTPMDWSRRHPDILPKYKRGGRTLFRLGDVLAYRARRVKNDAGVH